MSRVGPLLNRQLHYVCGKGGVGKSVVACALARAFARRGEKVLLAQIASPDTHSALLGIDAIGHEIREAEPGLFVVDIDPQAAMKEYALMTLKFEALYRTVFENRLTRAFLRFVPSMNEMTMQGKIWWHATENHYSRIVVDSPSTGHGLKLLRTAQVITDAAPVGPLAEKTKRMAELLRDPTRTALHVVTLPEELPVNESHDLIGEVRRTSVAPLGITFVNQVLATLFDADTRRSLATVQTMSAADPALLHLLEVASRRVEREQLERTQRARAHTFGMPVIELPYLLQPRLGRGDVERLADVILGGA
ncbi:MAG: ArsA family ATPase [Deltaproteobacteria bacterium]|nr:ArsA family ATPase [Deltaproteobacteria bacterium]